MKRQYITAILLSGVLFSMVGFTQTASAATSVCTDLKATLTIGMNNTSKGSSVIQLQDFLKSQGYLNTASTGYFGPATFKAVQSFQKANNFQTVGSVGPLTRAEIKKVSCAVAFIPVATTTPTSQVAAVVLAQPKAPAVPLPYITESFGDWHNEWGNIGTTSTNSLLIKNTPSNTSAVAILPNSGDWTNYKYTASVAISNGIVTLIARRVDDNNELSCVFIGNSISIQQKINGDNEEVAAKEVTDMPSSPYFQTALTVAMRVTGNTVGCTLVGAEDNVTYTNVDNSLLKGGIGIGTWFVDGGSANLELKSVTVTAI